MSGWKLKSIVKNAGNTPSIKKQNKECAFMKWFSINGIFKEIKRIRWPKSSELIKNSGIVILFTVVLSAFFYLCQIIISWFLTMVGM